VAFADAFFDDIGAVGGAPNVIKDGVKSSET
jgi:hypothetical protein